MKFLLIISSLGLFVSLGAMESTVEDKAVKVCDTILQKIFCVEKMDYTIEPAGAFMIRNALINAVGSFFMMNNSDYMFDYNQFNSIFHNLDHQKEFSNKMKGTNPLAIAFDPNQRNNVTSEKDSEKYLYIFGGRWDPIFTPITDN